MLWIWYIAERAIDDMIIQCKTIYCRTCISYDTDLRIWLTKQYIAIQGNTILTYILLAEHEMYLTNLKTVSVLPYVLQQASLGRLYKMLPPTSNGNVSMDPVFNYIMFWFKWKRTTIRCVPIIIMGRVCNLSQLCSQRPKAAWQLQWNL